MKLALALVAALLVASAHAQYYNYGSSSWGGGGGWSSSSSSSYGGGGDDNEGGGDFWTEFLIGVIKGVSDCNPQDCVNDVKESVDDFESAFQSFSLSSMSQLKSSLRSFGSAFNAFAEGMDNCGITTVAEDIMEMAAGFYDGLEEVELGVKIVCKGVDIYDDLHAAYEAYEEQSAEEAGDAVGELISLLIG
jgi:hypothetical protein